MKKPEKDKPLAINTSKYSLAVVAILLCSGCQGESSKHNMIAVNTLACEWAPGTKSSKGDSRLYAPSFTIDVVSGQEVRESEYFDGKIGAQRIIGDANRGAFTTTSSAMLKDKVFESVRNFFDPNISTVSIDVTRIYLKNMKGFTSRMRFGRDADGEKIFVTEAPPRQVQCKWEHQENKLLPGDVFPSSPIEGGISGGGILIENGWYELSAKIKPDNFYD